MSHLPLMPLSTAILILLILTFIPSSARPVVASSIFLCLLGGIT